MNENLAVAAAGSISARIDRLPPTRTVWSAILLLSAGMFFELYDLLFTAYIAPTPGQVRSFDADDLEFLWPDRRRGLHRGAVLRPVHRHDRLRLLRRPFGRRRVFVFSLHLVHAGQRHGRVAEDAFGLNLWRFISGLGLGVEIVTIGAYISAKWRPSICAARPSPVRRRSVSAACQSFRSSLICSCPQRRSGSPAGAGWCCRRRSPRR